MNRSTPALTSYSFSLTHPLNFLENQVDSRKSFSNPKELFTAQIADQILSTIPRGLSFQSSTSLPSLAKALQNNKNQTLREAFLSFSVQQRKNILSKLGEDTLQSLFNLSQQTNDRLYYESAFYLGTKLKNENRPAEALTVFATLAQVLPDKFSILKSQAQKEYQAISGSGPIAPRLAYQVQRMGHEMFSLPVILGLGGAQLINSTTKAFFFSRLLTYPTASLVTRGAAADLISSAGALALEAPGFALLTKGFAEMGGTPQDWSNKALQQDIKRGFITLGTLRGTGALTHKGIQWARAGARGLAPLPIKIAEVALPEVAAVSGLYLANLAEIKLGLLNPTDSLSLGVDALITHLQFKITGRASQFLLGPRFAKFIQELNLKNEWLKSIPLQSKVAQLAPSTPSGPLKNFDRMFSVAEFEPGTSSSKTPIADPLPTPKEPTKPPTSPEPVSKKGTVEDFLKRKAFDYFKEYTKRDLNRHIDPFGKPTPVITQPQPNPVRSIEEGIRLGLIRNQGERHVWRTRRDLELLETAPETRKLYLELGRDLLKFQQGFRDRISSVVKEFQWPRYDKSVERLELYHAIKSEIFGEDTPIEWADALINHVWSTTLGKGHFAAEFSLAELQRQGFDTEAIEFAKNHYESFSPTTLETTIKNHPLLMKAAGADEVLVAAQTYRVEIEKLQENIKGWNEQLKSAEIEKGKIKKEESVNTDRLKEIEESIPYFKDNIRNLERASLVHIKSLRKAVRTFLEDPAVARIWLVENALHVSLRKLLRGNIRGILDEITTEIMTYPQKYSDDFNQEFLRLGTNYLKAKRALENEKRDREIALESKSGFLTSKKSDFGKLWKALGAYERAQAELLLNFENKLILQVSSQLKKAISKLPPGQLSRLVEARRKFWESYHTDAEKFNKQLEIHGPKIRDAILYYDQIKPSLLEKGMRIGMARYVEFLKTIQNKFSPTVFDQEILQPFSEILGKFEQEVSDFRNKTADMMAEKTNPRDYNRSIEAPIQTTIDSAHRLIRKVAKSHNVKLGIMPRLVPMFETYSIKPDLPHLMGKLQNWYNLGKYAIPAVAGVARFESAKNHEYPFSIISRTFLQFGQEMGEKVNRQTFYVDPKLSKLLRYINHTVAADHNTHLDFVGHAVNGAQANLGVMATYYDIYDIIAKFDLNIPIIHLVFDLLTNQIPNHKFGIKSVLQRASLMQVMGDLSIGRTQPNNPFMYPGITMAVTNGVSPYLLDPHAPISGSLPVTGRDSTVGEAATMNSSRPQGLMFVQNPGAIRNYPSQKGYPALLREPSSYISNFFPFSSFYKSGSSSRNLTNDFERFVWMLQGFHPELDPGSPTIDRFYKDFQQPRNLKIERDLAKLFANNEEYFPTPEGIQKLEGEKKEILKQLEALTIKNSNGKTGEIKSQYLGELELVDQLLDVQTRRYLKRRLHEIDLEIEAEKKQDNQTPEAKYLRRIQRIVQSHLKLLNQIETKIAKKERLSLTEKKFIEKAGAAIAGRENISGKDHILEQLDYYFNIKEIGFNLKDRLLQVQDQYYKFVARWNERRKDPKNPEYQQIHISEAQGHEDLWNDYRMAIETTFQLRGITPKRWKGMIFPEIKFRRENNAMILEPPAWEAATHKYSRKNLWKFLLDDTTGIVQLATKASQFDPTPKLYLTIHSKGWGWRALNSTGNRLRLENTQNLREVANQALQIAPTHDSGIEFPMVPSILQDYGIYAFFMADRKFTDNFPKPPAFGVLRALLGPLEQYGHLAIDRSNRKAAASAMAQAGKFVKDKGRSLIIFSSGTRNEVKYDADGNRFEGPFYANRLGIASTIFESKAPTLPLGLVNGGIIFPKQNGDAYLKRGGATGMEYIARFGEPIHYDRFLPSHPLPKLESLKSAIPKELDRQHSELTGREVGPPAKSKAKKKKK